MNFRSNSKALVIVLLDRCLTVTEAAKMAGISLETFTAMIRRDKRISIRTAARLRSTFGDNVIRCEHLKGGETR